jgi:hypothetical protein
MSALPAQGNANAIASAQRLSRASNRRSEADEEIMREQDCVGRAKLSPARTFKPPMDVVETNDIERLDKLAILKAWEADDVALLRAEDERMRGGEHAHLQKVRAALDSSKSRAWLGMRRWASERQLNQGLKMTGGVR